MRLPRLTEAATRDLRSVLHAALENFSVAKSSRFITVTHCLPDLTVGVTRAEPFALDKKIIVTITGILRAPEWFEVKHRLRDEHHDDWGRFNLHRLKALEYVNNSRRAETRRRAEEVDEKGELHLITVEVVAVGTFIKRLDGHKIWNRCKRIADQKIVPTLQAAAKEMDAVLHVEGIGGFKYKRYG